MAIRRGTGLLPIVSILLSLILAGCASSKFDTAQKTSQLTPGMPHPEVVKLLGEPKSVQFYGSKVVLKYSLHEYWKGWVPYYLIFNKATGRLESWYADEEEYQRNQAAWMQAMESIQDTSSAGGNQEGGGGTSGGAAGYAEGYDPNANYYTDDSYWQGSGYHYDD